MERTRKSKWATSKLQRKTAPTVEEEIETEEMGGRGGGGVVEDYPEQPVLSPRAEEDSMPAQRRVERGNMTLEE